MYRISIGCARSAQPLSQPFLTASRAVLCATSLPAGGLTSRDFPAEAPRGLANFGERGWEPLDACALGALARLVRVVRPPQGPAAPAAEQRLTQLRQRLVRIPAKLDTEFSVTDKLSTSLAEAFGYLLMGFALDQLGLRPVVFISALFFIAPVFLINGKLNEFHLSSTKVQRSANL